MKKWKEERKVDTDCRRKESRDRRKGWTEGLRKEGRKEGKEGKDGWKGWMEGRIGRK